LAFIDDTDATDPDDPLSVYPRIFAAQDLVFARRAQAGRTVDLTCLQFGKTARLLGMPGELFVEYQLAAQAMAADLQKSEPDTAGAPGGVAVMMAAYGDIGPGYIGTAASYEYGPICYETSASRNNSRVTAAVEPVLMQGIQRLLERAVSLTIYVIYAPRRPFTGNAHTGTSTDRSINASAHLYKLGAMYSFVMVQMECHVLFCGGTILGAMHSFVMVQFWVPCILNFVIHMAQM
jgi:hypothetical protein